MAQYSPIWHVFVLMFVQQSFPNEQRVKKKEEINQTNNAHIDSN